jgi:hypothetical protein
MTPVFTCGFECGVFGNFTNDGHFRTTTGSTFSTTTVRNGNRSLRILASSSVEDAINDNFGSGNILVARFYIRFAVLPSATTELFKTNSGNGGVYFKSSDSKIYAGGGVAALGASGVGVTTGVWYLIDVKINSSANPHLIDVKVDGVACGQASVASVAGNSTQLQIGNVSTSLVSLDAFYDDLIISLTSADYPIGAGYVNHFVPTADGTHNVAGAADFRRGDTTTDILNSTTTAYQLVDDVPLDDVTPDADNHIRIVAPANVTNYVECVYGPAPGISTPTVAPRAVEVIAEFFAAGTLASDEILKLNDNGTVNDVYNGTGVAGTTTGIYKRKHYALAPTGGAWTVVSGAGNFNNIRFRYGYATDANPDKSLMCTMIEAEFQEIAVIPNKIVNINQAVKRAAYW